jgi:hypothetical protein
MRSTMDPGSAAHRRSRATRDPEGAALHPGNAPVPHLEERPAGRVSKDAPHQDYRHDSAFSRREFARVVHEPLRLLTKQRAQGMPGARRTRSLACKMKKAHERSHHRFARTTRHSLRNGFNGLFRALPGDRALLPPSSADVAANLTPASGRQDHTTSPYASAPFVIGASASTASRPASVTIANRPSVGRDDGDID